MRWIFICSDQQSSCKTAISSYLAALLDHNQIKINYIKLNPALTVKMGLLSPELIGEVFITSDGAQTDKDIGIIERSVSYNLPSHSFLSLGQAVNHVNLIETSSKSSGFDFLSIDENLINYIYQYVNNVSDSIINVIELGGSLNDTAGKIFSKVIMKLSENNVISSIHLGDSSQNFIDIFGYPPSLFVKYESVRQQLKQRKIESDLESQLKSLLENYLLIKLADFDHSNTYLHLIKQKQLLNTTRIALVGSHVNNLNSYLSVVDNLRSAGLILNTNVDLIPLNSRFLTEQNIKNNMENISGCVLLDGFGGSGTQGKRHAAKYCRDNNIPTIGICQGAYSALLNFSKEHGIDNGEIGKNSVIQPVQAEKIKNLAGDREITIIKGTLAEKLFKKDQKERFYTVNEINMELFQQLEQFGMIGSVYNKDGSKCKCAELLNHKMFVLCCFLPQFNGRYNEPHEIFKMLVEKSLEQNGTIIKE